MHNPEAKSAATSAMTMKAARLHSVGSDFVVDDVSIPAPQGHDVLVEVHACGVVPNLKNVITYLPQWHPDLPLPELPAIFGLDPAGVIVAVGPDIKSLAVGQRVYVNPGRACGSCAACRRSQYIHCASYTFAGYFGFGAGSVDVFRRYPWGGFAEYMLAPASSIVCLPEAVSFEQGARFGYLGTAYAALRKAHCGAATSVLVNGATGTLGVGAVLLALAMGTPKVLAVARNPALLARLKAIAPHRIETFSTNDGATSVWARQRTGGLGVQIAIDTLGPGSPPEQSLEALMSVAAGGCLVNVGGMRDPLPINPTHLMVSEISYIGSNWFTTGDGEDMAIMAAAGTLDLGHLEHRAFSLDQINEALDCAASAAAGGFGNVVVGIVR